MSALILTLRVSLEGLESDCHGAVFHRWLPDGKNDAIELDVDDPNGKLKVWFERCGYTGDEKIIFDERKRDRFRRNDTTREPLLRPPVWLAGNAKRPT